MARFVLFAAVFLVNSFAADRGENDSLPCAMANACLEVPKLRDADFESIAARIFKNETGGNERLLTYWGAGEDFPSLGIGHFIWFPAGVDAPFDESFPAMFDYLLSQENVGQPPEWLLVLSPFRAPWSSKQEFDAELDSDRLATLREWLRMNATQQAQFIVASFIQRWNAEFLTRDDIQLTILVNDLMSTPEGLFAVIDYVNFKGLGINPRERYAGEGWGLLQVLGDVAARGDDCRHVARTLQCFSRAAALRLQKRVALSPPSRNEGRWLLGWRQRVAAYVPPP